VPEKIDENNNKKKTEQGRIVKRLIR